MIHSTEANLNIGEDIWNHRIALSNFSIGPPPLPHVSSLDYTAQGNAVVYEEYIALTGLTSKQKGSLWSKLTLPKSALWQLDIMMRVTLSPSNTENGFAIWVLDELPISDEMFGGPNKWKGFAIIFDNSKRFVATESDRPSMYIVYNDGTPMDAAAMAAFAQKGCAIPMTTSAQNNLESIAMRITYMGRRLSLLIRPPNSSAWYLCSTSGESLSTDAAYRVGVSASTGEHAAQYQLVDMEAFTDLSSDPVITAKDLKNDIGDKSWTDLMDATREPSLDAEDANFNPIEEVQEINDVEEIHYDQLHDRLVRFKEEQKRQGSNDLLTGFEYTLEDLEVLSDVLGNTEIGQSLKKSLDDSKMKMNRLRDHIEGQLRDTTRKLNQMVHDIREREVRIHNKIETIAASLHITLDQKTEELKQRHRRWVWPFLILLAAVCVVAVLGYRRYYGFMKTHLL